MPEHLGQLTIYSPRGGAVDEIISYLIALRTAYNHLYAFELGVDQVRSEYEPLPEWSRRQKKRRALRIASKPERVVLPHDRLRLSSVVVESPGFWEFVGALNPLSVLREYLKDRHERRKDREYRESAERERLVLENHALRIDVLRREVDLLKAAGVAEDRIQQALVTHVALPLQGLDRYQDAELIENAEVKVLTPGEESKEPSDGS